MTTILKIKSSIFGTNNNFLLVVEDNKITSKYASKINAQRMYNFFKEKGAKIEMIDELSFVRTVDETEEETKKILIDSFEINKKKTNWFTKFDYEVVK